MATWGSPPGSGDAADAEPLAAPPARLRPGRVWYPVALAVIVAGVAWLLVGLAAFNRQIDSFQRVALPGDGEITLAHGGGYVIYYEGPGAAAGNAPALPVADLVPGGCTVGVHRRWKPPPGRTPCG
jgi:hypothetical protein